MVKVFFADAGSRDQLLATLRRIEADAVQRIATLAAMAATQPRRFPQRAHVSALGLKMQFEQEDAVRRWASWAQQQVTRWRSATDPGEWDADALLAELAATRSAT